MRDVDCVIVGGGMVGASLALMLGRQNYRVMIVEQHAQSMAPTSIADARTIALSKASQAIYQQLGMWEALRPIVVDIEQVLVTVKGQFGSCSLKARDQGLDALGYVIAVQDLESHLYGALAEFSCVDIVRGAQLVQQRSIEQGWCLDIKTAEQTQVINTKLLVAADGVGSQLAKAQGIGFIQQPYEHMAILCNVEMASTQARIAVERFLPAGAIALLPWQAGFFTCVWTHDQDTQGIMALSDSELIRCLQQQLGQRAGIIKAIGKRHSLKLRMQLANVQATHRCLLMGNAAHNLHPIAAQGFNLSLRDIWQLHSQLLATETRQDLGEQAFLDTYVSARKSDQDRVIFGTDKIARWMTSQKLPSAVRALGITLFDCLRPLKRHFTQLSMGV